MIDSLIKFWKTYYQVRLLFDDLKQMKIIEREDFPFIKTFETTDFKIMCGNKIDLIELMEEYRRNREPGGNLFYNDSMEYAYINRKKM